MTTQKYKIEGMTCGGCVASVTSKLEKIPGVRNAEVQLDTKEATVEMEKDIPMPTLSEALGQKYQISKDVEIVTSKNETTALTPPLDDEPSYLQRLYPLFLIFAYLTGTVLLIQYISGTWDGMRLMQHFMGGFFLIFSFFKLLDLKGFAMSFQMYDPIAAKSSFYAKVYPFIELLLGMGFVVGFQMWWLSLITLILLGIGTVGVARTVLNKKRIQCACLGTVFNLPMTKVTLIENSIMIVMAVGMLMAL